MKKNIFTGLVVLRIAILLCLLVFLVNCSYDRATFYYADIAPQSPYDLSITATNTISATIEWNIPDDSAYPNPEFEVYTLSGGITNLAIIVSNTSKADISNLNSGTLYSAWVRATNRAGVAVSSAVEFTTP